MDILRRIQNQPEHIRKIIFWAIIIFLGLVLLFTWIQGLKTRLEEAKERRLFEELKPPKFEEELKSMPRIEIPKFEEIEELLKEAEEQAGEEQTPTEKLPAPEAP